MVCTDEVCHKVSEGRRVHLISLVSCICKQLKLAKVIKELLSIWCVWSLSIARRILHLQIAKTRKNIRRITILLICAKLKYNKTYDLLDVVSQAPSKYSTRQRYYLSYTRVYNFQAYFKLEQIRSFGF